MADPIDDVDDPDTLDDLVVPNGVVVVVDERFPIDNGRGGGSGRAALRLDVEPSRRALLASCPRSRRETLLYTLSCPPEPAKSDNAFAISIIATEHFLWVALPCSAVSLARSKMVPPCAALASLTG